MQSWSDDEFQVTGRLLDSERTWVPSGTPIEIQGRSFEGGMLYVGERIRGVHQSQTQDPALINPRLKATFKGFSYPSYYGSLSPPNYSKLTPAERSHFLDWLAAGRPASNSQQHVLLFLYGLERRIFFDAAYIDEVREEVPALVQEAVRIGQEFNGYEAPRIRTIIDNLVAAAQANLPGFDPATLKPPNRGDRYTLSLTVQLALSGFIARDEPIPAEWALSWILTSPHSVVSLPDRRVAEEVSWYFAQEYWRLYGDGIRLQLVPPVQFLGYHAVSPGFEYPVPIGVTPIPVVGTPGPELAVLEDVVLDAVRALQDFSDAIPYGAQTPPLTAYAYLPSEIGPLEQHPNVAPFFLEIQGAFEEYSSISLDKSEFMTVFPEISRTPTIRQAEDLTLLCERLGFGIEPNPITMRAQFGRANEVGLYRYEFGPDLYYAARDLGELFAFLAMWGYVAAADGPVDVDESLIVVDIVESLFELEPFEQNRLHAHAFWVSAQPPTLNEVRHRLSANPDRPSDTTAMLVLALAASTGPLSPKRMKALGKIYVTLGCSEEALHRDLHRLSTAGPASSGSAEAGASGALTLDPAHVAQVRQQTDTVAQLLHDVFGGANESVEPSDAPAPETNVDPYRALTEILGTRVGWSLSELSAHAQALGLMASGAIETINDRSVALEQGLALDCDGEWCDVIEPAMAALLSLDA